VDEDHARLILRYLASPFDSLRLSFKHGRRLGRTGSPDAPFASAGDYVLAWPGHPAFLINRGSKIGLTRPMGKVIRASDQRYPNFVSRIDPNLPSPPGRKYHLRTTPPFPYRPLRPSGR
jgi:hypothetical protein